MRYHRFDFPDLPLEAFKHYGDRRIKPQGGGGGFISNPIGTIVDALPNLDSNLNVIPKVNFGGGGGGGGLFGGLGSFISNPLGTVVDTASNIINGASDTLHAVTAPILDPASKAIADVGEGISDVVHSVGTTVAKSPLLSTAAYAILVANQVPPSVAAALVSANAGAPPEAIARNMVLAGVGSEIASQVAPEIAQLSDSKLFGQAAGQAAGSAATAAVAGKDPLAAALTSFVSSGANVATGEIVKDIPGFDNLPRAAQDSVRSAVSASLQGKDPTMAAVSRAMNAGVQEAVKYGSNIFTGSVTNPDQFDFGPNQGAIDQVAAERATEGGLPSTSTVDESYLSNLSPADLARYNAMKTGTYAQPNVTEQDLGITQDNIDSYIATQAANEAAGKWPASYTSNQDGTATRVNDDGSTITIDDKNNIVHVTEAPKGNLISDKTASSSTTKNQSSGTSGSRTGTTSQTQSSTSPVGFSNKIPWLSSSEQMLRNAITTDGTNAPEDGDSTLKLKNIFDSLTPELKNELANRGVINNMVQAPLSAPIGFAQGGSSSFCSTWGYMGEYAPKFYPLSSSSMLSGGGKRERQLPTLAQLKQIGSMGRMAEGGLPSKYHEAAPKGHKPEFVTGLTGYYACGGGTGQSDDIPAMLHDGDYVMDAEAVSALGDGSSKAGRKILEGFRQKVPHRDGAQGKPVPAKIADGEYVFPASFVTALGGGDNKKGANILDGLREKLRAHKRSAPDSKIPPKAKSPLDYIKGSKG